MLKCVIVGLGGFIGSILRYLVGLLPLKVDNGFPIKTLIINVLGAFVIGLITALANKDKSLNDNLVLLLKVGLCGGFTTFSTFAYETTDLLQSGSTFIALVYVCASVVLGVLAVYFAQMIIHI
jgi:CrcB protein